VKVKKKTAYKLFAKKKKNPNEKEDWGGGGARGAVQEGSCSGSFWNW
jgi:hypothetical protein